jgi:hypothetical protein
LPRQPRKPRKPRKPRRGYGCLTFRDATSIDKVTSDGDGVYCSKQDRVEAYINTYDGSFDFASGKRTVRFDFSGFTAPPAGTDFAPWFHVTRSLDEMQPGETKDVQITVRIGDWQIRWYSGDARATASDGKWVIEGDVAEMKLLVVKKGKGRPGAHWEDHGTASLPVQFTFELN